MIHSRFGHVQVNIHPVHMGFYKDLFAFMGWQTLEDDGGSMFGAGPDIINSFWFFLGGLFINPHGRRY